MMNSNPAHEPDDYYEAISDDDSLGDVRDEPVNNNVNGADQEKDTFSLDLDALPFVPKFSSEIRNTVEAAAVADNTDDGGGVIVGKWGQENYRASATQMQCPYFPSEHGASVVPERGGSMNESAEFQNPIELKYQETLSQSSSHPFPFKDLAVCTGFNETIENQFVASDPLSHTEDIDLSGTTAVSESNTNTLYQGKSPVVDVIETQSAQSSVTGSNKIQESSNWLDENGDPIQGAFDQIEPDARGDPCVSIVNNTRVEYVFHVKEKTVSASHIESAESVNSQGSEACLGNVASTSCLSLEDSNTGGEISVSHVEGEEYDQKKLYEASKSKEEYQVAVLAASSSLTNEERKIEDSENKPKERFSRFKRNRFLDQATAQEPELTAQPPVRSEAELALESQALTELLREVKQGAERAKEHGALGWQKCPVPVVNKTFLRNTLVSTLREPYRPPRKRGQRHVGLEGRKPYDRESHSRSSSRSSRSDSRSRSSSRSRSRSSSRSSKDSHSRSRSHDGRRRKGFHGRHQRGHWPRGGPPNMYYDLQAMEAYMAQYGYPWYGPEAYAMYYEEGWPMDMYYGDPRAWAEYQSYYRGFPPRGRGHRGRGRGFYGNRWAEEEEVVYSDDEDFSSSSLSPSPSPDKEGQGESSGLSSKKHSQKEGKGSWEKPGKKDSDGSKVKKSKRSKGDESGTDEASESGAKQKKKKKKKRKKKKHKKIKKDESEEKTSKKSEGENGSLHEGNKSEDHIVKAKSEDEKAKGEDEKCMKVKKKVVKKKPKTSDGDNTADASGGPAKKKKKLVSGSKTTKTGAKGKLKGKGKGKSKVKKKISSNKKSEYESKGEYSVKDKDGQEGHANVKEEEGTGVDGYDVNTNVSENSKASYVGDQDGKPAPSTSSVSDVCQEAAEMTGVDDSESQKEEQEEAVATEAIPDGSQEGTVTECVDKNIQKPDSADQNFNNANDITEEVKGDPKCMQDVNATDVQVNKREKSQVEQDKGVHTSKKARKGEICPSQTEKMNRHSDSKIGRDRKAVSSSVLREEGTKKEKKRKREMDSDGLDHHGAKRKRDNAHDKGERDSLRDHSSGKGDSAEQQQTIVTGARDERRNTKGKTTDGDKNKKDGDKRMIDGDKRKTDAKKDKKDGVKGRVDGDKRKKAADKDKKERDKRKMDGYKRKTDANEDNKDRDKGNVNADKRKRDADKKKTDGKDSTPVLLDAREKIEEKRRRRELERQREMEALDARGDTETTRKETLKSPSSEDSHIANARHEQSEKDESCDHVPASSVRTPGKSKKRDKKSTNKHATTHIQDQEEMDTEKLKDKQRKAKSGEYDGEGKVINGQTSSED